MVVRGVKLLTDVGELSLFLDGGQIPVGEPSHDEGERAVHRSQVEAGLHLAFITDGYEHVIDPNGSVPPSAINALIDYMVDTVGFRIQSMHRDDLIAVPGQPWHPWEDVTIPADIGPAPEEIADALDAAYLSVVGESPSTAGAIAFILGFERGMSDS